MQPRLSRTLIAEAALDIARSGTIERVSLRQVAGALGVVPSALYGHIADRDDLFRAVAERAYDELTRTLLEASSCEEDDVERVRAIVRAYYRFAVQDPVRFRIMTRFRPQLGEHWSEDGLTAGTHAFAVAASAVRRAIAAGRFRAVDSNMASLAVFATARGTATFTLPADSDEPSDEGSDEALAFAVLDMMIEGLVAHR